MRSPMLLVSIIPVASRNFILKDSPLKSKLRMRSKTEKQRYQRLGRVLYNVLWVFSKMAPTSTGSICEASM